MYGKWKFYIAIHLKKYIHFRESLTKWKPYQLLLENNNHTPQKGFNPNRTDTNSRSPNLRKSVLN